MIIGRYNDFYIWDFIHNLFVDMSSKKNEENETKVIKILPLISKDSNCRE